MGQKKKIKLEITDHLNINDNKIHESVLIFRGQFTDANAFIIKKIKIKHHLKNVKKIAKLKKLGQTVWLVPVIPALPRSSSPAWAVWQNRISTKDTEN